MLLTDNSETLKQRRRKVEKPQFLEVVLSQLDTKKSQQALAYKLW